MPVTINGTTGITNDGTNLVFTGTGQRITGDFSNATVANRVAFQTSTANGATSVGVIPNGTGTTSQVQLFNSSDLTNYSRFALQAISTEMRLYGDAAGTGTALPLTVYTGGSERMRVTTTGDVGIGTSSPAAKLDVVGERIRQQYTGAPAGILFGQYDSSGNAHIQNQANAALLFATNNTERIRITSSGDVGIGTNSPGNKLDIVSAGSSQIRVKDGVGATAYYDFGRDTVDGFFGFSGAQTTFSGYKWSVNAGTEVMRITNGGNVGIGTSSPQSLLDLTGNDPTLRLTDNAGSPAATFSIRSADASFRVRDVTNSADRLTIDSAGKVILSAAGQGIQFADGTTQTTAAGGAPEAYAVGAYIVGNKNTANSSATTAGETVAGGNLRFTTNNGYDQPIAAGGQVGGTRTPGLSGTWRAMQSVGSGQQIDGNTTAVFNTLWCRIS